MKTEELAAEIANGNESVYQKLLERVDGLLWKAVRKYGNRLDDSGRDDLYQEAQIVCLKAARSFDISRGLKFSTFLVSSLRALIGIGVEQGVIYVPQENGTESGELLATKRRMRAGGTLSLDYNSEEGDGPVLQAVDAADTVSDILATEEENETKRILESAINEFPDARDRDIIVGRLRGDTLAEIAKRLGVSKARLGVLAERNLTFLKLMVAVRTGNGRRRRLTADERKFVHFFQETKTIFRIATLLGRCFHTIKPVISQRRPRYTPWRRWDCRAVSAARDFFNEQESTYGVWARAAKILGLTPTAVRSKMQKLGLSMKRRPFSRDEFRALHAQGWSTGELGKHFGYSMEWARIWQNRLGLGTNCWNDRWKNTPKRKEMCSLVARKRIAARTAVDKPTDAAQ